MKKKLSLTLVLLCVLIMLGSATIYAAYLSYGWPNSNIPIRPYSYNDTWQGPMDQSLSNWNNSNAGVTFSKDSSSRNTITADRFDYGAYGYNYATYVGSILTKFDIELNARTISFDANNFSNFVQSVFVHENLGR